MRWSLFFCEEHKHRCACQEFCLTRSAFDLCSTLRAKELAKAAQSQANARLSSSSATSPVSLWHPPRSAEAIRTSADDELPNTVPLCDTSTACLTSAFAKGTSCQVEFPSETETESSISELLLAFVSLAIRCLNIRGSLTRTCAERWKRLKLDGSDAWTRSRCVGPLSMPRSNPCLVSNPCRCIAEGCLNYCRIAYRMRAQGFLGLFGPSSGRGSAQSHLEPLEAFRCIVCHLISATDEMQASFSGRVCPFAAFKTALRTPVGLAPRALTGEILSPTAQN